MTTPERTVEEIVEELLKEAINDFDMAKASAGREVSFSYWFRDELTQTLQTERQRCEEMVEAERERIYNYLATRDLPDEDGCSPVLTAREMAVELKQALIKQ